MNVKDPDGFYFEMGKYRPPNEGQDLSLLLRITRNCPWNKCQFCNMYKGEKFSLRKAEEIKREIDVIKQLSDEIKAASWKFGFSGEINDEVIRAIFQGNPEVYGESSARPEMVSLKIQNIINVANWVNTGAKTVFFQDANSLIMKTPHLIEIIKYLKETFPGIERITSYARSKTCARKSLEELKELRKTGLNRLHVGLESGCDQVLESIRKGVAGKEHIEGGKKVVESGITLSEYIMPGLGGRRWSKEHAAETARVLSEINPDFIRIRSFVAIKDAPLYEKIQSGEFEELSEDEMVGELELLLKNLNCNSYLTSDHIMNLLPEIEGRLPEERDEMLKIIKSYKAKTRFERLTFQLNRRLSSYARFRGLDPELEKMVQEAKEALQRELPDAEEKATQAIYGLKEGFV
jgi:radical SAM superfamily enzyme YgiQ (UPF0313 family)